jgi:hypothetical protein
MRSAVPFWNHAALFCVAQRGSQHFQVLRGRFTQGAPNRFVENERAKVIRWSRFVALRRFVHGGKLWEAAVPVKLCGCARTATDSAGARGVRG